MQQNEHAESSGSPLAPYPGSHEMPRWDVGELSEPPRFSWKNLPQFLGPGLMMGGAAIGGGEWLLGPLVTAKYGGGMLWLATLSILGQVLYNIEISRYALYTGEPIFNAKFRTKPGPKFWLVSYIFFDLGSIFPYLASNAAIPVAMLYLGRLTGGSDEVMLRGLGISIFLIGMLPLLFGGKILNSLKVIMTFKAAFVLGFLLILGIFYSRPSTWIEIFSGFVKFGNIPTGGSNVENVFALLWRGESLPKLDLSMISALSAMVAIAGQGGLSNAPLSNYTRDQGWGMGSQVGAIPSLIGGYDIQLSHVGKVFLITTESLKRWKGWVRHVMRDQLMIWMPACFIGLALPSMLSVEFLTRGSDEPNKWAVAGMTADGVRDRLTGTLGQTCWYLVVFCGALVLVPTVTGTADGFVRRWVDVFWSASARLRKLGPEKIKYVYSGALLIYVSTGIVPVLVGEPTTLVNMATAIFNFALGFSCWHVVAVNTILLPKEIRPSWLVRGGLIFTGLFFWSMAIPNAYKTVDDIVNPKKVERKIDHPSKGETPVAPEKKAARIDHRSSRMFAFDRFHVEHRTASSDRS